MITWFLFALGAAIAQSCMNALSNRAVKLAQFSKITISFVETGVASLILLGISYFLVGFPELGPDFWRAVLITGAFNTIMIPVGFKAYEVGEFSSVYSMSLTAPIFILFTAWIFLGESPPIFGTYGVILSVFGIIAGFMTVGYAAYLLIRHRTLIVRSETLSSTASPSWSIFLLHGVMLLFLIGIVHALNAYFYNSALMMGFVSYTIAIKRIGVLFGVLWGWLFFREKNISKKFLGAIIAILGILLILLA